MLTAIQLKRLCSLFSFSKSAADRNLTLAVPSRLPAFTSTCRSAWSSWRSTARSNSMCPCSGSTPVDPSDRAMMLKIIHSAINTKALNRWSDLACGIALDAVRTVEMEEHGRKEIDIKQYAKVEKVPPPAPPQLPTPPGPAVNGFRFPLRSRAGSSRTRVC